MTIFSRDEGPDQQFAAHLAAGRFMIQRATESGRYVFYPRAIAPGTGEDLEWVEASGRGTIHSWTVVHHRPPVPSAVIVLVDLEEGPRMLSSLVSGGIEKVAIGAPVTVRIVEQGNGHLVMFDLASDRGA